MLDGSSAGYTRPVNSSQTTKCLEPPFGSMGLRLNATITTSADGDKAHKHTDIYHDPFDFESQLGSIPKGLSKNPVIGHAGVAGGQLTAAIPDERPDKPALVCTP